MKNLVLVAAFAVFALGNVNAQDESVGGFAKGDTFITGSVAFGNTTVADEKVNQFRFNPSVGHFVTENIAVGLALGVLTGKQSDLNVEDLKSTALTVGAFGQYYFTPENQFSMLVQLSAAYTSSKIEQGQFESKNSGIVAGFAPGVNYFVSECLALQANVGVLSYQTSKPDVDNAESTNTFNFGIDLTDVNFGITYKF